MSIKWFRIVILSLNAGQGNLNPSSAALLSSHLIRVHINPLVCPVIACIISKLLILLG